MTRIESIIRGARRAQSDLRKRIAKRARIHHIYFVLAAFDVLAVAMGLYLSHYLNGVLKTTIQSNVEWNHIHNDVTAARRAAMTAKAPGIELFSTRDFEQGLERSDLHGRELEVALAAMKSNLAPHIPDDHKTEVEAAIRSIDSAYDAVALAMTSLFDVYRRNQIEAYAAAMLLVDRHHGVLLSRIDDLTGLLIAFQLEGQRKDAAVADRMQKLEYVLCLMILLMVGAVTIFGQWIGHNFQKRHQELDAANARQLELMAQLQDSHADVLQLNAELECLNLGLEQRIQERMRELEAANTNITDLNVELAQSIASLKEAQDEIVRRGKLAQLGQIAATFAHEIRNPLGSVKAAIYLIERKVEAKLDLQRQFDRISNGIRRCDNIISELLDFAQSRTLSTCCLTVDDWLKECVAEETPDLPDNVRLELSLAAGDATAVIDPHRMRRVVGSLLTNALEAIVCHGEQVYTREGEAPTIWVSSAVRGDSVHVTVRDNGPGMSEDIVSRIMEPLFTTKSFGVGLGLPAAEQILRLHGGELRFESAPGEGATFVAIFPTLEQSSKAA